ncbi:MAG: PQQ-dependent sugar dehydrogenase [Alphaproteobacteria bacterium]
MNRAELRRFSPARFAPACLAALVMALTLAPTKGSAQTPGERTSTDPRFRYDVVAEGLDHPWGMAFLPDGSMLVTERPGRLRVIRGGALHPAPVTGVPAVLDGSQGGLFEVHPHPAFARNGLLYLTYAHGTPDANGTRLARARFNGASLSGLEVLFTASPSKDTMAHYGGRMAFLGDGTLLLTLGDGFDFREEAQNLNTDFGTIVRLNDDGTVPGDNPFVDQDDARDEIWSFGHRNPQGIVVDRQTGRVFAHEHGPRGGDEVNLVLKGRNYGWPIISYGVDYSGALITPFTERAGLEQPLKVWVPSIAPAGMDLYRGQAFAEWSGDLLIAGLVPGDVRRLDLEGTQIGEEEILFADIAERIRDVRVGPDGSIYLLTDSTEGQVIRVSPR